MNSGSFVFVSLAILLISGGAQSDLVGDLLKPVIDLLIGTLTGLSSDLTDAVDTTINAINQNLGGLPPILIDAYNNLATELNKLKIKPTGVLNGIVNTVKDVLANANLVTDTLFDKQLESINSTVLFILGSQDYPELTRYTMELLIEFIPLETTLDLVGNSLAVIPLTGKEFIDQYLIAFRNNLGKNLGNTADVMCFVGKIADVQHICLPLYSHCFDRVFAARARILSNIRVIATKLRVGCPAESNALCADLAVTVTDVLNRAECPAPPA